MLEYWLRYLFNMTKKQTLPWDFLQEFRGKDFKGEWPTFAELLNIQSKRYPERPFFVDFSGPSDSKRIFTYSDVYSKVQNIAKWLCENGLKKGEHVIVTGKNSPEWATVYLSVLYANGIIIPLDNGLHENEIINLVSKSDPKFIFCDDEKKQTFNSNFKSIKTLSINNPESKDYVFNLMPKNKETFTSDANENDTAAILFTSGTTGNAKGVMLSHKNLISDGYIAQQNFNHYSTDVFYALLPIHHAYTMQAAFINPFETGASIVFGKSMAVSKLMKELKEGQITVMLGVPLLYNKLLSGINKGIKSKGPVISILLQLLSNISFLIKKITGKNIGKKLFKQVLQQANIYTLRVAICGGGPLATSVFKQYNAMGIDFIQGYGLTETSPIIALNPVDKFKIQSVGKDFYPYEEVKIINKNPLLSKKEFGIGEIAIKGPMVMQGYYNMPEETKAMFTDDGFLKTGDLGWMDKDRYIMLCGRAKNVIVTSGGKNVYPEEIEDSYQLYFDSIQQIVVQSYIDNEETKSEAIEALIYPSDELYKRLKIERNNFTNDEVLDEIQEIVNKVNKSFQPYSQISRIKILDKPLEMTTSQKIKRNYNK